MKNSLVFAAVLLLFGAGCKKIDVGPPASGDPIFMLKGALDGQNFDWQAGNDARYMLAFFDGDSTKTPRFVADLGQHKTAVENDFPKIVIEIFGEGSTKNWPLALAPREVFFAQKDYVLTQKRILELQNTSSGNAPIASKWAFGNLTSDDFSPVFELDDLQAAGPISLETTDAKGRTTRQTGFLDFGAKADWRVRLKADLGVLTAQTTFPDPSIFFQWDSGDTSNTAFVDSTKLDYSVAATFSNGQKATAEIKLDPSDIFGPFVAAADFSWSSRVDSVGSFVGNGFQALGVLIKFIDDSGREFRSDLAVQSASNFFEILAVEDFERNEAGVLTKKIRVKFDCALTDEKGSTKRMSAVEGTVAVGVPD